jgi:PASTA domain
MRYQVSRGRRVSLLVSLAALLLGVMPVLVGCEASAQVSSQVSKPVMVPDAFTYVPLLDNRDVFPHIPTKIQYAGVLSTVFTMMAGERRRVTDQLEVRIPSGHGSEVGNSVNCYADDYALDPGGKPVATAGSGTDVGQGVNGSDAYQWNASLLLVAPAAGNYTCQIQTYAVDKDPSYVMEVLASAPGQTAYGTWLEVSSGNEADAQTWSYGIGTCHTDDSTGICHYIGGSGRPSAINVFSGDDWTADPDATTFDAAATFQITDCWAGWFGHGDDSCAPNDRGDGIFGMSSAEGDTWLEADQLTSPNGPVCAVNRAYSEESTDGHVQLSERYYDSDNQHHLPLYFDLSAPVSQLCGGSRLFRFDLHIGWTAGNPVKIDGGWINVIDSVRAATTTVVPDVTGRAQAQADDAIEANGLTTAAPGYVTSTAPVGTVLDENSPAGTIEPAGSPVQLTLSVGYVTVPNVVGDKVPKAEAAIRSAGLMPKVNSSVSNCVDPEIVLGQTPGSGAQVAPGSLVGIGITACSR